MIEITHISSHKVENSISLHILIRILSFVFLMITIQDGMEQNLNVDLIFISLLAKSINFFSNTH